MEDSVTVTGIVIGAIIGLWLAMGSDIGPGTKIGIFFLSPVLFAFLALNMYKDDTGGDPSGITRFILGLSLGVSGVSAGLCLLFYFI